MADKVPPGQETKVKLLHEWRFRPYCRDCKTDSEMWFQIWWHDDDGFGLRFSYSSKPISEDWSEMARYNVEIGEPIEVPSGTTHVVIESDGGLRRSEWTGPKPQLAFRKVGDSDGRKEV